MTAPDGWGFVSGSTLYAGVVNGFNQSTATNGLNGTALNLYGGVTLNTPIKGWRFGASYDYASRTENRADAWAGTLYSSYQLTEKASLHLRGEYAETDSNAFGTAPDGPLSNGDSKLFGVTATVQYDLWKNVISRLEFIWDHQAGDNNMTRFGGSPEKGSTSGNLMNRYTLALNVIYRF